MGEFFIQIMIYMKDILIIFYRMGKEKLSLVQVTNIKEILKKEKGKELENIFFLTKQYIMVNLKIINSMEKEFWNGQII